MSIDRLNMLKKKKILPVKEEKVRDSSPIPGFELEEGVYVKRIVSPLSPEERALIADNELHVPFTEQRLEVDRICYFDLETTGLSRGGGSIIFLGGFGLYEREGLVIYQLFLDRLSNEYNYLERLSDFLDGRSIVSYNGKSYDVPMIKSRITFQQRLNREGALRMPLIDEHLDLLYYSRSFFRTMLVSCSLGNIEENILDIHRVDDIDGAEVPVVYFDYLKSGVSSDLLRVFSHNEQDILSLHKLLFHYIKLFRQRDFSSIDHFNASKYFFNSKKLLIAEDILTSLKESDLKSIKLLSSVYKRQGDFKKAVVLWLELIYSEEEFDPFPYEELAKYYEHKEKDYKEALQVTEAALKKQEVLKSLERFIDMNLYERIYKRKLRLLKKIAAKRGKRS